MNSEQIKEIVRQEILAILGDYSVIPIEITNALTERLPGIIATGTGVSTTQAIVLTGNPQTINPPAQPSGTLKVTFEGTNYELLYK